MAPNVLQEGSSRAYAVSRRAPGPRGPGASPKADQAGSGPSGQRENGPAARDRTGVVVVTGMLLLALVGVAAVFGEALIAAILPPPEAAGWTNAAAATGSPAPPPKP